MIAPALLGGVAGWTAAGRPKAQGVRLLDVWILGPFMLLAANEMAAGVLRTGLTVAAAATITYNGRNYLERRELGP